MVKRSRLEMSGAVLSALNQGLEKQTPIMYRTNLSWIVLNEIFESLAFQKLVRYAVINGKKRYYITNEGKEVLSKFQEVKFGLGYGRFYELE